MIVRDESDVRKWVKTVLGARVFWVEPRSGGTVGFPDCVAVFGPRASAFIELKAGPVREIEGELFWRIEIRPAQRAVLRRLLDAGAVAFLLVGRVGTVEVGWVRASVVMDGTGWVPWRRVEASREAVEAVATQLKAEIVLGRKVDGA